MSAAPAKCFHDSLVSLQQRVHGRRNVARPRVFERTRRSSSLGRPSSASLRMRPAPRRARPRARPPRAGAARATRPRQLALPRRTPRASAALPLGWPPGGAQPLAPGPFEQLRLLLRSDAPPRLPQRVPLLQRKVPSCRDGFVYNRYLPTPCLRPNALRSSVMVLARVKPFLW